MSQHLIISAAPVQTFHCGILGASFNKYLYSLTAFSTHFTPTIPSKNLSDPGPVIVQPLWDLWGKFQQVLPSHSTPQYSSLASPSSPAGQQTTNHDKPQHKTPQYSSSPSPGPATSPTTTSNLLKSKFQQVLPSHSTPGDTRQSNIYICNKQKKKMYTCNIFQLRVCFVPLEPSQLVCHFS